MDDDLLASSATTLALVRLVFESEWMVERMEWRRGAWPTGRRGMEKRGRGPADAGSADAGPTASSDE
jgi:hypothetical protein